MNDSLRSLLTSKDLEIDIQDIFDNLLTNLNVIDKSLSQFPKLPLQNQISDFDKQQYFEKLVPNVIQYFPQSLNEFEIAMFNIRQDIPLRLLRENDDIMIVKWFMENDTINRSQASSFLYSRENSVYREDDLPNRILHKIAIHICCNDNISFIKAFQLFAVFVGIIYPNDVQNYKGSFQIIKNDKKLVYLLRAFITMHLQHSRRPIQINSKGNSDRYEYVIEKLCQAMIEILQFFQAYESNNKPIRELLNELQLKLRKSSILSNETMNQLFEDSVMDIVLPINEKCPSYMFSHVLKEGWVKLSFSCQKPLNYMKFYARLCSNALYLFSDPLNIPQGCIPMQNIRPCLASTDLNVFSLIELKPITYQMISYVKLENQNEDCWYPGGIMYYPMISLEILDQDNRQIDSQESMISSQNSLNIREVDKSFDFYFNDIRQWLEHLDTCSFQSY